MEERAHSPFSRKALTLPSVTRADGAAGTMFEALSHLDCTINPQEIQQKAGGGASCSFDPGAN